MKKIIAIVTIGASTAFLQVQAQEAPQTERTQDNAAQSTPDTQAEEGAAEARVKIEESALPQEVKDSFEKGEYGDMDIVSVYEVNSSGSDTARLEEAANQAEQAVDEAATGMKPTDEEVARKTETTTAEVSQDTKEEASEFAQNTAQSADSAAQKTDAMTDDVARATEQTATDVGQETQERVNNAAMETEGLIEDPSQAVGDTAINEAEGGDQMKEPSGSAPEQAKQPVDSASLGVSRQGDETVVEMSEDVAKQTEGAITEMETTEEMENTGKVVSAETPDANGTTTQPTTAEAEEKGKELYDNNQYDNYTEANSSAYKETAENEIAKSGEKSKKYELQVKGNEGNVTLTYDEHGELVKADKGSM